MTGNQPKLTTHIDGTQQKVLVPRDSWKLQIIKDYLKLLFSMHPKIKSRYLRKAAQEQPTPELVLQRGFPILRPEDIVMLK